MMNRIEEEIPEEIAKRLFHHEVFADVESRWAIPVLFADRIDTLFEPFVALAECLHGVLRVRRLTGCPMDLASVDHARARIHLIRERPHQIKGGGRSLMRAIRELGQGKRVQHPVESRILRLRSEE